MNQYDLRNLALAYFGNIFITCWMIWSMEIHNVAGTDLRGFVISLLVKIIPGI